MKKTGAKSDIQQLVHELQVHQTELEAQNEELRETKDELQSLNEELTTVNNELQEKVDELSNGHDDMNNLLNSTNIAAVFIDDNMNNNRYTPATEKLTNFIESDIGRPFHHVSHKLKYDHPKQDIQEVMDTLQSKEVEVQTEDGQPERYLLVFDDISDEKATDSEISDDEATGSASKK